MEALLDHEIFSKYLNTQFRIFVDGSNSIYAELSEINELQLSPHQERFAIVFRGPREPLLEQGTYRLEHDEMGEFILFIVPLRQDDAGTFYEAVFNRMRKAD
jgi:hypothetical protein